MRSYKLGKPGAGYRSDSAVFVGRAYSLSIVTTLPAIETSSLVRRHSHATLRGASLSALLTPISLLLLGFHPYAEDGGLYLTGVKYLLNPSLFPHMREFVTAPLHYSVFAPCMASLVRFSGLSFDHVVFGIYLVCLWATILAAWSIAQQCFATSQERLGATLLIALWMSLPVAGTSLMLIDPYLTARSFSTPLTLFAVASALHSEEARKLRHLREAHRSLAWVALLLLFAAIFHPLMAGYGAAFTLAILWMEAPRPRSKAVKAVWLLSAGLLLATGIQTFSTPASAAVRTVSLTRSYWFLAQWQWFELVGLLAPLLILTVLLKSPIFSEFEPLAVAAVTAGVASIAISACFARSGLLSFGVAHLQPLRVFQLIYVTLLLGLGAWLARFVLRKVWWRWTLAAVALSVPVMIPALLVFPHSAHIEQSPRDSPRIGSNQWVEAFRWIQRNTPTDALFALDANYISDPSEDAQSFRAIAERSVLPDYSKDGGETAVNSALSAAWVSGVDAQQGLSRQDDTVRYERLRRLGVTWMVLQSDARTSSKCPYDNGTVKVCALEIPSSSVM